MQIKDVKQVNKGPIKLTFTIYFDEIKYSVYDYKLMESNGKPWVAPPTREYTDAEGKKNYFQLARPDEAFRDHFAAAVLEKLKPHMGQAPAPTSNPYNKSSAPKEMSYASPGAYNPEEDLPF